MKETMVSRIEQEHQLLRQIADELHAALFDGREAEVIGKTLTLLYLFAIVHFSTEERLMADCDYPEIDAHRKEHAGFRRTLDRLSGSVEHGSAAAAADVLRFIDGWAGTHRHTSDKRFLDFLATRPISG